MMACAACVVSQILSRFGQCSMLNPSGVSKRARVSSGDPAANQRPSSGAVAAPQRWPSRILAACERAPQRRPSGRHSERRSGAKAGATAAPHRRPSAQAACRDEHPARVEGERRPLQHQLIQTCRHEPSFRGCSLSPQRSILKTPGIVKARGWRRTGTIGPRVCNDAGVVGAH